MALQIQDPETERRVRALAQQEGVSTEEIVRRAVEKRMADANERYEDVMRLLRESSIVPTEQSMTKAERETILGYGSHGF